ncbi:MAG TPA: hypothetical protein VF796_13110 [Humisphaera sp.]
MREALDRILAQWQAACDADGLLEGTSLQTFDDLCDGRGPERFRPMKAFCDQVVALGPPAVPHLVRRMARASPTSVDCGSCTSRCGGSSGPS